MTRIPFWIDIRHVKDQAPYLEQAARAGCEHIIGQDVRVDGDTLVKDGLPIATYCRVHDAASQAAAADQEGRVIVECDDWTIIPLENLIGARADRPDSLYAVAKDPQQVRVFGDTLDRGVHGIVLCPQRPGDVAACDEILRTQGDRSAPAMKDHGIELGAARVLAIEDCGTGDRVCIDATSAFAPGEGLLIGSTAASFALIHAESVESEFVAARPFRVNAGALPNYVLAEGRTHYLSEVTAGTELVAHGGPPRKVRVGRAKIERRPFLLVRWQAPHGPAHVVVQNAETTRFVTPDGPKCVTDLVPGDHIMVHHSPVARHFGMPIDERLVER